MNPRFAAGSLVQWHGTSGMVIYRVDFPWASRPRYIVEIAPGVEIGAWEWELEAAAAARLPLPAAERVVSSPVVTAPVVTAPVRADDDSALRFSLMELD